MNRRTRGLAAGSVFLAVCALGWPSAAPAAAANAQSSEVNCALAGANISVVRGPVGTGHFNVIIEVKNAPFEPCLLPIYAIVDLFDQGTGSYMLPTQSPEGPLGGDETPTKVPTAITLPPGEVASALLGGTDIPRDDVPTCPAFSYTVSLPDSTLPAHFDRPLLPDCSGFVLGPFALGFNGESPTGEVVGTATPSRATVLSGHRRIHTSGGLARRQVDRLRTGRLGEHPAQAVPDGAQPRSLPHHVRSSAAETDRRSSRGGREHRTLRSLWPSCAPHHAAHDAFERHDRDAHHDNDANDRKEDINDECGRRSWSKRRVDAAVRE